MESFQSFLATPFQRVSLMRDFTEWDHPISLKRDHRKWVFRSVSDES
jgi:hypothetical protein